MITRPSRIVSLLNGSFFRAAYVALALTSLAGPAGAVQEAVPLASDPRIKTLVYGQDQVYRFTGYLRYQSSIELAPGETVTTISMGDSTAWQFTPMGSRIFIKPIDLDASTNMTLITNKRVYLFELAAEETASIDDKNIPFIVRFVYPDDDSNSVITQVGGLDKAPNLDEMTPEELSKFNFRYTLTGSDEISPIRIFDDGEFTYFEFRGANADVPAFFRVLRDGSEELINFRTRGNYIVVERVSGRYTLRQGVNVVCVFNEAMVSPTTSSAGGPASRGVTVK